MRVLIACEYSGTVRDAFIKEGHDAWSCDILPTDNPGPHFLGKAENYINQGWDLIVAHPPCTYLTSANGNFNWKSQERFEGMVAAVEFFKMIMNAPCKHIAIENPQALNFLHRHVGRPDQTVHPYHFGDSFQKRTGWWLKNLPPLKETNNVYDETILKPYRGSWGRAVPETKQRGKIRSKFFPGMSKAIAEQWGAYVMSGSQTRIPTQPGQLHLPLNPR